tara:strand:+ start:250 stop:966 length:717 start_codon:yes stop_codon:yes gene_type:complete
MKIMSPYNVKRMREAREEELQRQREKTSNCRESYPYIKVDYSNTMFSTKTSNTAHVSVPDENGIKAKFESYGRLDEGVLRTGFRFYELNNDLIRNMWMFHKRGIPRFRGSGKFDDAGDVLTSIQFVSDYSLYSKRHTPEEDYWDRVDLSVQTIPKDYRDNWPELIDKVYEDKRIFIKTYTLSRCHCPCREWAKDWELLHHFTKEEGAVYSGANYFQRNVQALERVDDSSEFWNKKKNK